MKELKNKNIQTGMLFTKSATSQEDLDNFIIRGVFSTQSEDRHGDIVDQKGWLLERYLSNPVILFGHDHSRPAIGKMIELTNGDNLAGAIQFAVNENPEAKLIFNLYANGFMRAFSCGFINHEFEYDQINDRFILKSNELIEVSCVNVPSNWQSLAKELGFDEVKVKAFIGENIEKECPCDKKDEPIVETPADETPNSTAEPEKPAVGVLEETPKEDIKEDLAKTILNEVVNAKKSLTKEDLFMFVNKSIRNLLKFKKEIK